MSAERIEKARKFMEEGQSLYAQRKYLEAAKSFQQAYAAQPFAAFLFNEAVCYEKAGDFGGALATFRRYLAADPNPPDADSLKARIKRLEEAVASKSAPTEPPPEAKPEAMHSLLFFESNPAGAPAQIWQKVDPAAAPFPTSGEPKGWKLAASGPTPLVATLIAGRYHVVTERFRSFNRSDDELDVATGRVVQYRAGLSQGDFMGFVRVTTEVDGAKIYLDDPPPHAKKPWGVAPHGELVPKGDHEIWIEAPGYEPYNEKFSLDTGQQKIIQPAFERVGYGYLNIEANAHKVRVMIDGEEVGIYESDEGPLRVKATKGTHRLRALALDRKPYEGDVEVAPGQTRDVRLALMGRYSRGAAWISTVGSALALGTGIYFGVRSNQLNTDLHDDRRSGRLAPDDKRASQGKTFSIVADAGFGVSLLLAGYATYEFLHDPLPPSSATSGEPRNLEPDPKRPPSRSSLRFAPTFAPGQGGLLMRGAF